MRVPPHPIIARGFSIVELMVAMLIALIGTIVIFQVFEVSEGIKRTTTSGGDAQQNGAISLNVLEYDLRNAGMGFNDTDYTTSSGGCSVVGRDTLNSVNIPASGSMPLVPVTIVSGSATYAPDTISVFYGSQAQVVNSTTITANQTATSDSLHVTNRYGFRTGDLILVLQPNSTGANCTLMEVTGVPATPGDQIDHGNTAYAVTYTRKSALGTQTTASTTATPRFNPPPGSASVYGQANTANAARVFNLGNLYDTYPSLMPVYNTYAITPAGGSIAVPSLTVTSPFSTTPTTPAVVADNVVHMRAVYGLDDGQADTGGTVPWNTAAKVAGDGIIDHFVDSANMSSANWKYLIAIRIAVVTRSALPEKPAAGAGAVCDTTTSEPTWSGTSWASSPLNYKTHLDLYDPTNDPQQLWKCYRYHVFETTVPLRNWIWKSS